MNIEQPLGGMTWRELRAFVAMGEGMPDSAEVTYDYDDAADIRSMFITGWFPAGGD
jgi:hypothetical protein